ncbi:MAG TPA: GNAT family N-acetyltransferase [Micromonosporaceae bacterium]|jgi:GNAT superfamily N-acetyltransferase|nr:GNAT family N-acetyltransferase [Micromonosporaceae bacterium]
MVREWDPRTAPSAEIDTMVHALNALLATDLPDDPPWRADSFREYLSVTMPGERRINWIAEDTPGSAGDGGPRGDGVLGSANILLFDTMAVLEVLVHPDARRTGVGQALLRAAVARAHAEGFGMLGVEAIGGTPAVKFYEAMGFECAYMETRSVLELSTVDWLKLGEMAAGVSAGYKIEYFPGGPPEELYESYAAAKYLAQSDVDQRDLDLRPSSHNADRLRASLRTLHMRGMKPYIVLGIHEASGEVVGLTEVVVAAQHPDRADQYDTVVVPEHRGYGLGRAVKARMLFELRSAVPKLKSVQTWNSFDAEGMLKVNAELGFRPDREWREYQADVAALAARLGVAEVAS